MVGGVRDEGCSWRIFGVGAKREEAKMIVHESPIVLVLPYLLAITQFPN